MSQRERRILERFAVVKGPAVSISNFIKVIYPVLVPCNKIVADRSVSCAAAQFRASNESLGGERCCAAIQRSNAARVASQPNVKPVRSTIVRPQRLRNHRASNMFASDYAWAFFLFLDHVRIQPYGTRERHGVTEFSNKKKSTKLSSTWTFMGFIQLMLQTRILQQNDVHHVFRRIAFNLM